MPSNEPTPGAAAPNSSPEQTGGDALPPALPQTGGVTERAASKAATGPSARVQRNAARRKKIVPMAQAIGKDMLTSYMDQLSGLPLYTAAEEIANAKALEQEELRVWHLVLASPRALELLLAAMAAQAETRTALLEGLRGLDQSYRRTAARSHKRAIGETAAKQPIIDDLARQMRVADFDKELLEVVMAQARQEVWSRRVLTDRPAYRITHADLTEIEKARGASLRTRNHFVRANLRLVVSVARNFHHFRIPFIDLVQEGNVGLMKAVHRFDHNRGFRFSTYAHWWIRQSIERAIINKGSQVRLPVHVIDARRQVNRARAQLSQSLGRGPSAAEVAALLGIDRERVEAVLTGVQQDPISLDEQLGGDDSRRVLDLLRDQDADPIDEALIRENTHAKVRELLHLLNPIEKDIIRRRFGLGADVDQTLDEIGRRYNLSRERVRQIQAQSLQKMRRMCERRRIE